MMFQQSPLNAFQLQSLWDASPGAMMLYNSQPQLAQLQMSQCYANQGLTACFGNGALANMVPPSDGTWEMERATSWADEGREIIARMAFWSELGIFGWPMLNKLADRLDRVTDQVEDYAKAIARIRDAGKGSKARP